MSPGYPRARAAAGYARIRPLRTPHARSCLATWPRRDRARARWRRSRRSGKQLIESDPWPSALSSIVNDAAVDDSHQHRQVEQVVGVSLDGIRGEPGEIGAVAWFDPPGHVVFGNGRRRAGRVALEALQCGQRLAASAGWHLQVSGSAAEPRPGHPEAWVERRDHPVRSQSQNRAGGAQGLRAKGCRRALGSDACRPLVAAVGASGGHVQRLHRRHDAQLGETRHVALLDQLDMLDAVVNTRGATGRFIGVECRLHGAIADRVGDALEPGPGKERDGFGVSLGLRPERMCSVTLRVGLDEPGGAGLDHAVDKELGGSATPQPAAVIAKRELVAHLRRRRVGLLPERDDHAAGEIAVFLQPAIDGELVGCTVHSVDRREASFAEAPERVPEPAIARLGVDLGNNVLHEAHSGPLLQLAGRNAVDANDGRFFCEGNRPVDTGDRQRGVVGEGGVGVEELQQHWLTGGDTVEKITANTGLLERLVVEPPALHPGVRSDPLALREEAPANLSQTRGVEKVGALGADRAHQRVDMGVGQPGYEGDATTIDHPRAGTTHGADGVVVTGCGHETVLDRQRAARGEVRVQCPDVGSPDDQVWLRGHSAFLILSRVTTGARLTARCPVTNDGNPGARRGLAAIVHRSLAHGTIGAETCIPLRASEVARLMLTGGTAPRAISWVAGKSGRLRLTGRGEEVHMFEPTNAPRVWLRWALASALVCGTV